MNKCEQNKLPIEKRNPAKCQQPTLIRYSGYISETEVKRSVVV